MSFGEPSREAIALADEGCLPGVVGSADEEVLRAVADRAAHDDSAVLRVQAMLVLHHEKSLSIYDLAREVGMNRRILEQRFRRLVGRSIEGFLMQVRIDAAMHALRSLRSSVQTETFNC